MRSAGEHPEFVESIQMLEQRRAERLEMAEMWRTCQLETIEAVCTQDKNGADTDYAVRHHHRSFFVI